MEIRFFRKLNAIKDIGQGHNGMACTMPGEIGQFMGVVQIFYRHVVLFVNDAITGINPIRGMGTLDRNGVFTGGIRWEHPTRRISAPL